MIDFVLEQTKLAAESKCGIYEYIVKMRDYANFLKQPLELWMFCPCDEDGNVIELIQRGESSEHDRVLNQNLFNEGKERCLFEGFIIYDEDTLRFKDVFIEKSDFYKINIEGLEYYCSSTKLQLTPTAIKKIGL